MIQGQENPIFWIESGGLYEVSPNLTFTKHGWFTTAMMANMDFYSGLSDKDKKLVQDGADHAFEKIIDHIDGLADEALAKIQKASDEVTVTRLTDEQIEAFGEKLRATLTSFYGSALVEYGGQELNYMPPRNPPEDPEAPTNVRMQIVSDGTRIELQYALFLNEDREWKLRNLYVGGINLRRQYHTQFAALMARHNNDIDAVIEAWQ
jgi:ABC-type transporter MlaC component